MIRITDAAQQHFRRLIAEQGEPGLGVRLRVLHGGTPRAECRLEYCAPAELAGDEWAVDCEGFTLWLEGSAVPFLEGAEIDLRREGMELTLSIRAPRLRGVPPGAEAGLVERLRHLIETEINPELARHRGRVELSELRADGAVVLRFGGGCQGCGMVDRTLREGIERLIRARFPEITAVLDATDHEAGTAPYLPRRPAAQSR
ncbi:MAG: NfuA family Fe-S biogenesis protein [Xanthomonadales bacterium]|nr:NfuA family Fe-S biogenesis protein [Xanthomonadales bacterium]